MEQPRDYKPDPFRWDIDRTRYRLEHPPAPCREVRAMDEVLADVMAQLMQARSEEILLLCRAWRELVGEQVAMHSEPGFIKDFTLHVFADHPGWMVELERTKRTVLFAIKARFRSLGIRRIRYLLKQR